MIGAAVLPAFTVSIEGVLATLLPPDRVEISSSLLGIGLQLKQAMPASFLPLTHFTHLLTYLPPLANLLSAADHPAHRSFRPMPASLRAILLACRRRAISPAPRLSLSAPCRQCSCAASSRSTYTHYVHAPRTRPTYTHHPPWPRVPCGSAECCSLPAMAADAGVPRAHRAAALAPPPRPAVGGAAARLLATQPAARRRALLRVGRARRLRAHHPHPNPNPNPNPKSNPNLCGV